MNTTAKTAARIAAKIGETGSVRGATEAAAAEAITEARRMGWTDRTITGMVAHFGQVGGMMQAMDQGA